MVLRNIVKIDEEKCNGCGECVNACAEGAIEIVNGKAKLISEIYCDGLGACIGKCPQDAITVEKRESAEFDEGATKAHLAEKSRPEEGFKFECPGMMAQQLRGKEEASETGTASSQAKRPSGFKETSKPGQRSGVRQPSEVREASGVGQVSELRHWPVQLKLVSPAAKYFADADLLLVADCVPFAMGDFHKRFLKEHSVVVGCPKLDDSEFYIEKLSMILKSNKIKSLTVVHMEVPCCFGLTQITKGAVALAEIDLTFEDVTVGLDGEIRKTEAIGA
jgi:NAD-dependent dihydropyrimidine dehydrogenase PreA subunit